MMASSSSSSRSGGAAATPNDSSSSSSSSRGGGGISSNSSSGGHHTTTTTPATAAMATATATMLGTTTTSVAILIGSNANANASTASSGTTFSELPVVVWICQSRARQSVDDPWKHTLQYFEFTDDTARWTHLDQLLLRYPLHQSSLHVASSSSSSSSDGGSSNSHKKASTAAATNAKAAAQQQRRERLMENLQVFLEERHSSEQQQQRRSSFAGGDGSDGDDDGDDDDEGNTANNDNNSGNNAAATNATSFHWHTHVTPLDATKMDSIMTQLLLPDEDVQVAYRGNLQLHSQYDPANKLLQQGLALWLQAEQLLGSSSSSSSSSHAADLPGWSHSCKIQPGVLRSHLVMDRTAAACIHLLPPANAGVASVVGGKAHTNSLYGLLSQPCATTMGKLQLQLWLRQPLIDLAAIQYRQNAVTTLVQGPGKDSLRDALLGFAGVDLGQLAAVLGEYSAFASADGEGRPIITNTNTKRPLKALYQLYLLSAKQLPALAEVMEDIVNAASAAAATTDDSSRSSSSSLLQDSQQQVVQLLAELSRCQGLVEAVLDLNLAPREYLIQPSFSTELQELYHELQTVQQHVDDEHHAMQELWAQVTGEEISSNTSKSGGGGAIRLERCVVNAADGSSTASWQFRIPDTNRAKLIETAALPPDLKCQTHRVLKNGVYFSTRALRQWSTQYQQLSTDYSRQSSQIVADAMQVATTYQTVVERAAQLVATLDAIMALARVAAYSPHGYCKPILTDSDEAGAGIELKAARHPCVELQEDMEYIPNDVSLLLSNSSSSSSSNSSTENATRNEEEGAKNFMLVTGPNMGGKSTYIRALGAVVCMAQIGSYVPATYAKINICHSLQARVGAGDLQERGISTFMAEMLEASSILRTATRRSLIIIDELGRGTSTFDGYGLAAAISEYLQQRVGCLTVFATHFHELTHHPHVQNCHVTAVTTTTNGNGNGNNNSSLTFLYQVRPGPCLESFGIQVAEMAQVPSVVIEDAKRKAAVLEDFGNRKRQRVADRHWVQRFAALDDLPNLLRQEGAASGGSAVSAGAKLLELLA